MSSTSQPSKVTLAVQLKWVGSNKEIGNIKCRVCPTTKEDNGWHQARYLQLQVAALISAFTHLAGICVYDANRTELTLHPSYYRTVLVRGRVKEHPARKKALATLDQTWDALFQHLLDRQAAQETSATVCPVVWHVTQYSNADKDSVENAVLKYGIFA